MRSRPKTFVCLLFVSSLSIAGCGKAPMHGPPPATTPEVGFIVLKTAPLQFTSELPGRTAPVVVADVRPQISGLIRSRNFTEGAEVAAGALLYEVDPAPYQAQVLSAQAALAKARANLDSSRRKAKRYSELASIKAVSEQDHEDTAGALQQAQADVASAQASLTTSRINLRYTRIVAPVSGRIGRSSVTPGALVTADQAAALATIQTLDPLYVDVTQSSTDYSRLKRELESGRLKESGDAAVVRLKLEDGTDYPLTGTLQFSDVTVDQNTGAITLRASFPNPNRDLLPGMFVRAILKEGVEQNALLVPQAAVARDAGGNATAYVVGADNKLELRTIKTGRAQGDQWVVTAGLHLGDRLVVDGQQRAGPGVAVIPVALDPSKLTAMASSPASQE